MSWIKFWACSSNEKILPEVFHSESLTIQAKTQKSIAVLMTSAESGYNENLTSIYREETVYVHHPSHEEFQRMGMIMTHDGKAWAEMFLLSFTDKLVLSSWPSFGYVAHGLRSIGGAAGFCTNLITTRQIWNFVGGRYRRSHVFRLLRLLIANLQFKGYSQSVAEHIRRCEDMMDDIKLVDGWKYGI